MRTHIAVGVACLIACAALAQPQGPPPNRDGGGRRGPERGADGPPPPAQGRGPGGGGIGGLQMGPPGMWWNDPELARRLTITGEQTKKMQDIFQNNRTKMIDLKATLDKEEVNLEPLLKADTPDDTKILAQIDRVAASRA